MLEPRETRGITGYRPISTMKLLLNFNSQRNKVTLILLTSLMLTIGHHSAASLINDQSYQVTPTPILPALGADDVTTVLLVNNSAHHGRFLTVRPQIGLLTSTVRTFIQSGITTEFATKVVGTKLNNGQLYAQYLKKSSRVFYDNEHLLAPSVVTSWVGEGGETLSLQNHNELFNMDDVVDWQDIDDNLDEFVGNTDFVGIQTTNYLSSVNDSISSVQVNKPLANHNITATSTEQNSKDEITKLTDHLETFTVNNNVRHFHENVSKIQQHRIAKNVESPGSKRVLASVTYYGFADFTTIVGDSVIVFHRAPRKAA
ncbi:uncharacterized protein LOC110185443 [Drosophila serrata]|uniref:uncharacterized protein LOC110185443 n=1 Tax=Drosophila serrata TaxID=7274 RepID=UPI000A1D02A0|nr:uncharacterized protein LOC110185443 [Drosophila serrata]